MRQIIPKKKRHEPQVYRIIKNGYEPVMPSSSSELAWKEESTLWLHSGTALTVAIPSGFRGKAGVCVCRSQEVSIQVGQGYVRTDKVCLG